MFVLRVQAKGGFAALLETAAVLSLILTVGGEYSAAAVKNAGAFATVAYPNFVVACDQAFCGTPWKRELSSPYSI